MAYLDETYEISRDHERFYVVSAVVSPSDQLDCLRQEIDEIVPNEWWHTTQALQSEQGRELTLRLLDCLADGQEACIITHRVRLADGDKDGEDGRADVLKALIARLWRGTPQVRLAILEERMKQKDRRRDRATYLQAIKEKHCGSEFRLVQTTPSAEHLLWLPDLVCSAYRQAITNRDGRYLGRISKIVEVISLDDESPDGGDDVIDEDQL